MADAVGTALAVAVAKAMATKVGGALGDGLGRSAQRRLSRRPAQRALTRTLETAFDAAAGAHGELLRRFDVNFDFLEIEGAEEIALVLAPGGGPDPAALARVAVTTLSPDLDVDDVRRRTVVLTPAFATLCAVLAESVANEEVLAPIIRRKHEADAAAGLERVARAGGRGMPRRGDRASYLDWLIGQHRSVRTVGMLSSAAVDVPLDEVFVTLAAELDQSPGTRAKEWRQVEPRAADDEEPSRPSDRGLWLGAEPELVDVMTAVAAAPHLLILGDPGSGKTTLLRYLALRHARERKGRLLPVYVRVADFARSPQRHLGMAEFLAPHARSQGCKVAAVDVLVDRALEDGSCLVLLDGLDEVASTSERVEVVDAITRFVDSHHGAGNRFVVTSRISGYLAVPLPPMFEAYRVQPMDDETIERFLAVYCPAIERFYSRRSEATTFETAERARAELMEALDITPGMRRLATNPLMLTTLVIVHWVTGRLPTRRADAYTEITDALTGRWRRRQGVSASDLPDERLVEQWLTHLAAWLHEHRPDGTATRRELLAVLGPVWAAGEGEDWDDGLLDRGDALDSSAARSIEEMLRRIDQHTGLLVERAPQRYGFPHLTLEEFYAGRAVLLQTGDVPRAARLRAHLHDPRYEEPILLALGQLSRTQFDEEVDSLVRTAIYGDVVTPSPHEHLLGRDFLFALRILADDVRVLPHWIDLVLTQAVDELLDLTSRTRFDGYRRALMSRLEALAGTSAGQRLPKVLERAASRHHAAPERFCDLAGIAADLDQLGAETIAAVRNIASSGQMQEIGRAVWCLGKAGDAGRAALTTVAQATDRPIVRVIATNQLTGEYMRQPMIDALVSVALTAPSADVRRGAVQTIARDDASENESLIDALLDGAEQPDHPFWQLDIEPSGTDDDRFKEPVVTALTTLATEAQDPMVRNQAARYLNHAGRTTPAVIAALKDLQRDATELKVRIYATATLVRDGHPLNPELAAFLTDLARAADDPQRQVDALDGLVTAFGSLNPELLGVLLEIAEREPAIEIRSEACEVATRLGEPVTERTAAWLMSVIRNYQSAGARTGAARILIGGGIPDDLEFSDEEHASRSRLAATTANPWVSCRLLETLAGDPNRSQPSTARLLELVNGTDDPRLLVRAAEVVVLVEDDLPDSLAARLVVLATNRRLLPKLRLRATVALMRVGLVTQPVVDALVALGTNERRAPRWRLRAAEILLMMDGASDVAIASTIGIATAERSTAWIKLRAAGILNGANATTEPVVDVLRSLADHPDTWIRLHAIELLVEGTGTVDNAQASILVALAADDNTEVNLRATCTLSGGTELSDAAADALHSIALNNPHDDVRLMAIRDLGTAGRSITDDLTNITVAIAREGGLARQRRWATDLLATCPPSPALLDLAFHQLHDEDDDIRTTAGTTLAIWARQHRDVSDRITGRLIEACPAETAEQAAYDALSEITSAR